MGVNPRSSVGFLVGRASHLLSARLKDALVQSGLTLSPEEHSVLMVVSDPQYDQIRISDLADVLMRDPTTVKRQLNALFDSAYVERVPDPNDRRVVRLRATSAGHEAVERARAALDELRSIAMSGISKDDQAATVRGLQKMLANLLEA